MDLTISQALRKIAKLKGALKEHLERAEASINFTEAEPPAFEFADSMGNADKVRAELITLESSLRHTNALTTFSHGGVTMTLSEATCRLQEHKSRIAWLQRLPSMPQESTSRDHIEYRYIEGRGQVAGNVPKITRCALPQAKRAALVATEQEQFDSLNDAVENLNHRTSLLQG
jgi:hypothetical protein